MNLLLTGGTGFIGQALCDSLLSQGYRIFVLSRKANELSQRSKVEITYIHNLSQLDDVHVHGVINLCGETIAQRWTAAAKKRIIESRLSTTEQLIEYLRHTAHRPLVFVSASAVGYYGSSNADSVWTEDSPLVTLNPDRFSQNLCHDWETIALKAQFLGIRTVILRMGPVLNLTGGILKQLKWSFLIGLGASIGSGQQTISWIDLRDLIRIINFVLQNSQAIGVFNATSPFPVSYKEFAATFAASLRRPCIFQIPEFVLTALMGKMAQEMILEGVRVFPQKLLKIGFTFQYPHLEDSFKKVN